MEKQQLKLDQKQNLKYPDVMERSYIYNSQSKKYQMEFNIGEPCTCTHAVILKEKKTF